MLCYQISRVMNNHAKAKSLLPFLIHHCTLLMLDYEKVNQSIFDIES